MIFPNRFFAIAVGVLPDKRLSALPQGSRAGRRAG